MYSNLFIWLCFLFLSVHPTAWLSFSDLSSEMYGFLWITVFDSSPYRKPASFFNRFYSHGLFLKMESEQQWKVTPARMIRLKWVYIQEKESEVAHSCPTLCNAMDCNLPGSSVQGIFQARALKWVAISFSIMFRRNWSKHQDSLQLRVCFWRMYSFGFLLCLRPTMLCESHEGDANSRQGRIPQCICPTSSLWLSLFPVSGKWTLSPFQESLHSLDTKKLLKMILKTIQCMNNWLYSNTTWKTA